MYTMCANWFYTCMYMYIYIYIYMYIQCTYIYSVYLQPQTNTCIKKTSVELSSRRSDTRLWCFGLAQPCGKVNVSRLMTFKTRARCCADRQPTWHTGMHERAIWKELYVHIYIYLYIYTYIHSRIHTLSYRCLSRSVRGGRWGNVESTGM